MSPMNLPYRLEEITPARFEDVARAVFVYQYTHNKVYRQWANAFGKTPDTVKGLDSYPYLPVQLFKQQPIICQAENEALPELFFESSTTTGQIPSRHYVRHVADYENAFMLGFEQVYGSPKQYAILGLLPSYLERGNSSLVYMVNTLMAKSAHSANGFFLHNFNDLANTLRQLEAAQQPTLLFGVTYALLDFADAFPMPLQYTTLIETGGMKGRKKELIRPEVHQQLNTAFQLKTIHSEYGMTELFSQAWSRGEGFYTAPPWMKILLRDRNDPLEIITQGRGLVNIIDLANHSTCSFLAVDDMAILHETGQFEILGRADGSEIRGCSLLSI